MLGEVVVTALGLPKQARQVGYATTRVSTDEIERTNTINPVNALQGKVAGLPDQHGRSLRCHVFVINHNPRGELRGQEQLPDLRD